MMGITLTAFLVANIVLGVMNHRRGSHKTAVGNAFATGFVLATLVSLT